MAKVWTATSGPDEQQCFIQSTGQGLIGMSAEELGTIEGDGTYDGQPTKWDGDAWVPLPLGEPLVFSGIRVVNGEVFVEGLDAGGFNGGKLIVSPNVSGLDNNTGGECRLYASQGGMVSTYPLGYSGATVPVNSTGFAGSEDSTVTRQYAVTWGLIADVQALGFLGADIVVRQSITGVTTQDQVDSLVAALVLFGLVTDDR